MNSFGTCLRGLTALALFLVASTFAHAQDNGAWWSACPSPCQPQIQNDPTTLQYLLDTAGPPYPIDAYIEVCKAGQARTNSNCGVWKKQGGTEDGILWWTFTFVKSGLYKSGGATGTGGTGGGGGNPGAGTYVFVVYWTSCTVNGVDCKDV
jgi:hypothetical protein